MRVYLSGLQCSFRRRNKLISVDVRGKDLIFLKGRKNQFMMALEISSVLAAYVQDQSVSMFIHGNRMVKTVTNVCNAKLTAKL